MPVRPRSTQAIGPVNCCGEALLSGRRSLARATAEHPQPVQPTAPRPGCSSPASVRRPVRSPAADRPSLRQISATAPTGSWSRSKSGLPAFARSANSLVASSTCSGGTGHILSALHSQRFPTRCQHHDAPAHAGLSGRPAARLRAERARSYPLPTTSSAYGKKIDHGGLDVPGPGCCCSLSAAATA